MTEEGVRAKRKIGEKIASICLRFTGTGEVEPVKNKVYYF